MDLRSWNIFLRLTVVLLNVTCAMSSGANHVRCYCNLPECIDRGENSCKSRTGCFQELPHYNLPPPIYRRLTKGQSAITPTPNVDLRFGCLELWPSDSAPFQCTEPGIRKSPLDGSGGRRHGGNDGSSDSDDGEQWIGRSKNGDRSGVARRRSSANRHSHHNKIHEVRRWSAYDVPLRCCLTDMCNRRFVPSAPKSIGIDASSSSTTAKSVNLLEESSTVSIGASQPWWFTSTMIFVPVIGGITFFLLVAIGCWILHGTGSPCQNRKRAKLNVDGASAAHYYFYDTSGVHAVKNSVNGDSSDKNSINPCKCVVVETTDFSNGASGGRCVHILPIFLPKYSHGDCVVNVKAADTRTSAR